jgi:hypothetical protein
MAPRYETASSYTVIEEKVMNRNAFAALTRQAGAVSRRGSLRAFGGVVLATQLAAPANARAGKNRKARNQCKKQKARCIAAVTGYCSTLTDPPFCENIYLACCEEESPSRRAYISGTSCN